MYPDHISVICNAFIMRHLVERGMVEVGVGCRQRDHPYFLMKSGYFY